jgi:hypothetical protein
MKCNDFREFLEAGREDSETATHLAACRDCRDFAELRAWSRGLILGAAVEDLPRVPFARVLAAIRERRRGSEFEWSLARSFRRLVPLLAAISLAILLVGERAGRTARSPYSSTLAATSQDQVTTAAIEQIPETPSEILGVAPR